MNAKPASEKSTRSREALSRRFTFFALPFAILMGATLLTSCGSSGDDPPPADVPAPPAPPAPPPPPPPPPPPGSTVPPLATPAIAIDDGHPVGTGYWGQAGDTSDGGQGQVVAGKYPCGSMDETYHVHTHLSIFLNGEQLRLPYNIGIVELAPGSRCFYALHTHDASGKIHVEGPAPALFTLGDFFAIWGHPLSRDNVAGFSGMPVVVYLVDDGVVTEDDGDITAVELKSQRQIVIQIGTEITESPDYTWTGT
jgi:hypothetical protein